jgi:DNA-binding transcriptional ArsR family regulator
MESKQATEALGALAQDTRLAIFRLLVQEGAGGLPAGSIGERLEIPAPTLSFHLAQLVRAGLALSKRQGRSIYYAANYGGMNALLAYLTEDCCQGRPEICGGIVAQSAAACGPANSPKTTKRRRVP